MDEFRRKPTPWTTRPTLTGAPQPEVEADEQPRATHVTPRPTVSHIKIIPPSQPAQPAPPTRRPKRDMPRPQPVFRSTGSTKIKMSQNAASVEKPTPAPSKQKKVHKRSRSFRIWFTVGLLVFFAAVGAGGYLYHKGSQPPLPFSKALQSQATFPLFYANPLPNGFSLDKNSTATLDAGVLTFTYDYLNGVKVAVTEQAKPTNFSYDTLQGDGTIQTRYGKAIYRLSEAQTVGSLVTDKTWIIFNATSAVATSDISALLTSMQPAASP